jgi:hypothetical protein
MVQLTIGEKAAAALAAAREQVELRDESGQRIGYFLPPALHERLLYDWAQSRVAETALKAARTEEGGSTLADVWARLGGK